MSQGTLLEMKTEEIFSIFEPVEGLNTVYYGKVRNGKTYAATADILELLERGEIVYANWNIDFEGLDERKSFARVLMKFLFGKPIFYNFKKDNFHYMYLTVFNKPEFLGELNRLVGVHIFIDEGQWIFNSHLKTDDLDSRRLILEGGHYCRTLNVITQRPQNILKDIRSQVHIWYKCEKVFQYRKIIRFVRWEIEDMQDDLPLDPDDMEKKPPSKGYWGSSKVFNAYNTHGRRSPDAKVLVPQFEAYEYTQFEKIKLLFQLLIPSEAFARLRQRLRAEPVPEELKKTTNYSLNDLT